MRPQFKKNVASKIINNFDKEATYEGSEFISREDFENSGLFKKIGKYTRHKYSGEDFVRMHVYDKNGKNATEITFSELHVRLGVEETYNRRRKKDFFWGMFYKIKFNKSFNSELYLNSYKRKNMDLEDYDFNKIFSAHTNDQVEARYILSTSFMERLKEFKKLLGDDVKLRVSFIDNIMYVAVNSGKDFFEPKANKDLSDFNNILPYYLEIEYLVEIVEILNLNLKIWN